MKNKIMNSMMDSIKKYIKKWNATRIFQLVMGGSMIAAYLSNHDNMYLFLGAMLTLQAALGIGCFGGSCGTNYKSTEEAKIKVEKYNPKKE